MAARTVIMGSLGRGLYGVLALFFPKLFERGPAAITDDDTRYFNRLFGARDILVAFISIVAVQRGNVREAVAINLIAETSDAVANVQEIRERGGPDASTIVGVAFNVVGFSTWLSALRQLRAPSP